MLVWFFILSFSVAWGAEAVNESAGIKLIIHGIASGGKVQNLEPGSPNYTGRLVIGQPFSGVSKNLSSQKKILLGLLFSYGRFQGKIEEVDILNEEEWEGKVVVDNKRDDKVQVNLTLQNRGFYTLKGNLLEVKAYRGNNTTAGGGIEEKGAVHTLNCPSFTVDPLMGAERDSVICNVSISELDLGVYRLAVIFNDKYGRPLDIYSNGSWSELKPKFFNWELNNLQITEKNDTIQPNHDQRINASACRNTGYGQCNWNLSRVRNESLLFESISEYNEIDENKTVYKDLTDNKVSNMSFPLPYKKFNVSYIPQVCGPHRYFVNITDQAGLRLNGAGGFDLDCILQITGWYMNKSYLPSPTNKSCDQKLDCYDFREDYNTIDRDMNGTTGTLFINFTNEAGLDQIDKAQWWVKNQETGEVIFNVSLMDRCDVSNDYCSWSIDQDLSTYACDVFRTQLDMEVRGFEGSRHSDFLIEDIESTIDFNDETIIGSNQSLKGSLSLCSGSGNYSGVNVTLGVLDFSGGKTYSNWTELSEDGSFEFQYEVPKQSTGGIEENNTVEFEAIKYFGDNPISSKMNLSLESLKTGFKFQPSSKTFGKEETGGSAFWFSLSNPTDEEQTYSLEVSFTRSPAQVAGDEVINVSAHDTYRGFVDFLPVLMGHSEITLTYENKPWSLDNDTRRVTATVSSALKRGILSIRLVGGLHLLGVLVLVGLVTWVLYQKKQFFKNKRD